MRTRTSIVIAVLLLVSSLAAAQESGRKGRTNTPRLTWAQKDSIRMREVDTLLWNDNFLDTVRIHKKTLINDYSMIGVTYGLTFGNFTFSPARHNRAWIPVPGFVSVMYTHYEKMMDMYANFGFRTGIEYGHEAFGFQFNDEYGQYYNYVDGAHKGVIEVVDIPVMACMHFDLAPLKFQGGVGVYGGYRLSIEREGEYLDYRYEHAFHDYEKRWDYGLRGNAGIAFMIDPVEFHLSAEVRWGWQSLYEPDYNSKYYYRFAYPLDISLCAGVHFQLGKRLGKTSKALRRQAKEIVYGKKTHLSDEELNDVLRKINNPEGQDRK